MNNINDLYELQWNNHTKVLKRTFDLFRNDNELVDVTLSCEGKKLKAHKIVLSACSMYFLDLFRDNPCQHPIVILRDIKYQAMVDILSFMYTGEVNVAMECLNTFLQTAEFLQIKGLTEELPDIPNNVESASANGVKTKQNRISTELETQLESNKRPLQFQSQSSLEDFKRTKISIDDKEKDNEQIIIDKIKAENIDIQDLTEDDSIDYVHVDKKIDNEVFHDAFSLTPEVEGSSQIRYFPCPHCDKVFNHQVSLKLHLPQHSGRTSCGLCNAVLSRTYELKVHMRKKHNIDLDVMHSK